MPFLPQFGATFAPDPDLIKSPQFFFLKDNHIATEQCGNEGATRPLAETLEN